MTTKQLTLSGSEVQHPPPKGKRGVRTRGQQRVLSVLRREGVIRSVEAGVLLHQQRGYCAFGTKSNEWPMRGLACCPYASADGRGVMVRLLEKGLVIRGPRKGTWLARPEN